MLELVLKPRHLLEASTTFYLDSFLYPQIE